MTMYKHNCVKIDCSNNYEDEDVDAYYCVSCREKNKAIAKEVDAKTATFPKRTVEQDDEITRWKKQGGFMPIIR